MPSTITATLQQSYSNDSYISFIIRGEKDFELDTIFIEKKTPRKHRNKACWGVSTHYKALSIGDWLFRLEELGFDITEFKQACAEMGWQKEVDEYLKSQELNSGQELSRN